MKKNIIILIIVFVSSCQATRQITLENKTFFNSDAINPTVEIEVGEGEAEGENAQEETD